MERRYAMDELEYASGYQRMYGVSDDAYLALERNQDLLARFDVEPTCKAANRDLLAHVAQQQRILQFHGYNPTAEDSAFEALRTDFIHTTASYEGNTLTLAEVSLVVDQGCVVPGKSLDEHLEVIDIRDAFNAMVNAVRTGEELSVGLVLKLHALAA